MITEAGEMKEVDSGQGAGFAAELYVVWGTLCFPLAGCVITLDDKEGKLNFSFNADPDKTIAVDVMSNTNVQTLVAGQKEGENMTRSVVHAARDMLLANLMNDTVLVVDLDAALNGMGRREDANG